MVTSTTEHRGRLLTGVALLAASAAVAAMLLTYGPSPSAPAAAERSLETPSSTEAPSPVAAAVGTSVVLVEQPQPEQVQRTTVDTREDLRATVRERLLTMNDSATPYSRIADPLRVVGTALENVGVNPHRKKLGELQMAQFTELVRQHADRVGAAFDRATELRAEALLRSVQAGRFTFHMNPDGLVPDLSAGDDRQRTSTATGIRANDLVCRTSLHRADNGDYIHAVTYVTRQDEPGYFLAAELVEQLRQQRERDLRAFLAAAP